MVGARKQKGKSDFVSTLKRSFSRRQIVSKTCKLVSTYAPYLLRLSHMWRISRHLPRKDIYGASQTGRFWLKVTGKENSSFCMMTSCTIMILRMGTVVKQAGLSHDNLNKMQFIFQLIFISQICWQHIEVIDLSLVRQWSYRPEILHWLCGSSCDRS